MVVTLGDGTRVKCPVDVRDRATYILVEQGDWCEPEVSFVRRFIEPGMSALDVGASHGVYALSLARRMGGRGRVVALEPIRAAFERLEQSLVENALQDTLTVIRAGLSNIAGEVDVGAQARRKPDNADADCGLEPAPMMTAKELMEGGRWPTARRLDFVRLNAGDQQLDILRHWPRELSEHSPLVMLRIDSGCSVNDAAKALAGFGMPLFRLVPSLGALVEYELGQPLDPGVRNLFTCTRERAEMLFRRGLIV
ncbi:FkbM family methyltransferase [Thiorhodococcus minor]|nr:FkbM family methyltransferase [Thiorhodococcus minor]